MSSNSIEGMSRRQLFGTGAAIGAVLIDRFRNAQLANAETTEFDRHAAGNHLQRILKESLNPAIYEKISPPQVSWGPQLYDPQFLPPRSSRPPTNSESMVAYVTTTSRPMDGGCEIADAMVMLPGEEIDDKTEKYFADRKAKMDEKAYDNGNSSLTFKYTHRFLPETTEELKKTQDTFFIYPQDGIVSIEDLPSATGDPLSLRTVITYPDKVVTLTTNQQFTSREQRMITPVTATAQ